MKRWMWTLAHVGVGCLALLLVWPAYRADARSKKSHPKSDRIGQDLKLVPDYLVFKSEGVYMQIQSMTYQISFTNLTDHPKLSLNVHCRMNPEQMPYEYSSSAKIHSVKFDNGWEPSSEDFLTFQESRYRSKTNEGTYSFTFQIFLPRPPRSAKTIKRLEGTVSVVTAELPKDTAFLSFTDPEDARRTAEAGPFRLTLKNVQEDAEDGRKIAMIEGEKIGAVWYRPDHFYKWKLVYHGGKQFPFDGTSGGRSGADVFTFRPSFTAPGKIGAIKGILVSWTKNSAETEIPFVFENIPLP